MHRPTTEREARDVTAAVASRGELIARLRALGTEVTPDSIAATQALYAPLHARDVPEGIRIERDLRYGTADRHRLDVFVPENAGRDRPVLIFVHGGGFVMGDKSTPGSPFYDNVGLWAARHGIVGVTMTYRLAPAFRWPSGSDDVAAAVNWVRENIASYGGDAQRIFVMGQSAGAVHVGGFVARAHPPGSSGWRPAGAILVSGMFDTRTMERNVFFEAYFGTDPKAADEASFLEALAGSPVPLMMVTAELDGIDFLRQNVRLLEAHLRHRGRFPRLEHLHGHNHLSTVLHLGTDDESLARPLLEFIADNAGTGEAQVRYEA
jgi:Esterase/lipase|nr:MAG: hypothetical protein DIU56_05270 [Pseudomonadota bacterium]